jgi:plastocyanin
MNFFGQVAVGIILLLIVVGGLLFIFYSRTNSVAKTGYGSITMLALVSIMIPIFWIMEGGAQASQQNQQQALAIQRGMQIYAQNCTDKCFAIDKNNKVLHPTYLGYTVDSLNKLSDDQLKALITAGSYNPNPVAPEPPAPSNVNTIPRSDQFGGQLNATYIDYLFALIRSADPSFAKKQGFTGDAAINGFTLLPDYLQANYPRQYNAAVSLATVGQFGQPVDKTNVTELTINMVQPTAGASCTVSCFELTNVKVKVGTKITWVNKTSLPHTVTAIEGSDTAAHKIAPQIFDSGMNNLIQTGKSFSYTVTADAYNFNPDHTVIYYCQIHPDMLAELTIVQ